MFFPRFTVECSPLPLPAAQVTIWNQVPIATSQETRLPEPVSGTPPSEASPEGRLDSWKEIAAYLKRDVTTVQRWEKREGMPVHRHLHDRIGSVYAFTSELDAWQQSRNLSPEPEEKDQAADAPKNARSRVEDLRQKVPQAIRFKLALAAVAVLVLLVLAYATVRLRPGNAARARIKSLAVLPLKNLSGDPSQEYLADGMTEALIGRLSGIHDLRVISRTSVMRFKDTQLSVPEIAKTLGVDAVVEGSVMREGNRIRVHAQLIRAATDEHFWSEAYDRELREALALESDVAQSIARRVEVTVTGEEHSRLVTARSVSPDVYESYLKGRFSKSNGKAGIEESIGFFAEAIRKDPTFAPAYVGLATAHARLGTVFVGGPPEEERMKVASAARKALELDPELAEAHVLLADIDQKRWQWADAEAEYKRALELNPNDAVAHSGFARWLICQGRTEEALAWGRRGRELDPLGASGDLGWILFLARRYDEAMREMRIELAVRPDDASALWYVGFVFIAKGQPEEAIPVLERTVSLMDRSPGALGLLATAYARAGRRTEAFRLVNELKRRQQTTYIPAGAFINPYLGLGDYDQALIWFERAYEEKSNILQWLKVHPFFDPLRDDPRFKDLLHRVGLDQP